MDRETQAHHEARVADGEYDFVILSSPCATWSRAECSGRFGPDLIRSKKHLWWLPDNLQADRVKAQQGNEFAHTSIRMIGAAVRAREQKRQMVCNFLEHPEDVGTTPRGTPASIWQLQEMWVFADRHGYTTFDGHQCQAKVDWPTSTRSLSEVPGIQSFRHVG